MSDLENVGKAVSIALCTYNGEKYLAEQIDSILKQDYPFIDEIICIDDNSTDSTWQILSSYAERYPFFKIIQNKTNLGFVKNFEKAILSTKNQLIAISDQDDIWYANKISRLVSGIGNSLMVYSDNVFINETNQKIGIRFSDKRNLIVSTSCLNFALFNAISGHTVLFKRELLNYALPFPAKIHYDWWLAFCASQHTPIQYVSEPMVGYRQHASNAVGGYGVKKQDKKEQRCLTLNETSVRISFFAQSVDPNLTHEKQVLQQLAASYLDRSFVMRMKRISLFWQNWNDLLLFKKRNSIRKMVYCFKVFWKYD
jgi:glycosyltransferase involved in cell wall biosynthesis